MSALPLVAALLACAAGCGRETDAGMPASLETDQDEMRLLKTIPSVPVEGLVEVAPGSFRVAERESHVRQFPCTACHLTPLPEPAAGEAVVMQMHVDIVLAHAPAPEMDCRTCHHAGQPDRLTLNDGTAVGLNHAYRNCVQCHFQQGRDWVGGAHGKRLGGWTGERIIMNCTACHDPHQPAFDVRWPLKRPHIPR